MISANPRDPLLALSLPKSIIQSEAILRWWSETEQSVPSVRISEPLSISNMIRIKGLSEKVLILNWWRIKFLCLSHLNQTISWWLKDNFFKTWIDESLLNYMYTRTTTSVSRCLLLVLTLCWVWIFYRLEGFKYSNQCHCTGWVYLNI